MDMPLTPAISTRRMPSIVTAARELFAPTMAEQVVMTLDDHDRLIAYVLGLSHALNIAFFTALAESGEAAPKLARLSSTTFDAQLDVATWFVDRNLDEGRGDRVARTAGTGTTTYRELAGVVDRAGNVLRELGLGACSHIIGKLNDRAAIEVTRAAKAT